MPKAEAQRNETAPDAVNIDYEAPRIELIVSQESMKREVHYAGLAASPGG
jgi:hypothetical protein